MNNQLYDNLVTAFFLAVGLTIAIFLFMFFYGGTLTLHQIIVFFFIMFFGVTFILITLAVLDNLYIKTGTSIIAFIIEYSTYGVFLSFLFYFVFDFVFYENLLLNTAAFAFLVTAPIFFHEIGHFSVALSKGYKPILVSLRFISSFTNDDSYHDASSITLGATLFYGEPSWSLSASGPLMNLFLIIFGICIVTELKLDFSIFIIAFLLINFILFIWNIEEIWKNAYI